MKHQAPADPGDARPSLVLPVRWLAKQKSIIQTRRGDDPEGLSYSQALGTSARLAATSSRAKWAAGGCGSSPVLLVGDV
jgi:hypothetical protein